MLNRAVLHPSENMCLNYQRIVSYSPGEASSLMLKMRAARSSLFSSVSLSKSTPGTNTDRRASFPAARVCDRCSRHVNRRPTEAHGV